MQLLADKLVELEIVECISDETVRTALKKIYIWDRAQQMSR